MSKVVPLPGVLVVGGEYPPRRETRIAVLDAAQRIIETEKLAAHVVDLAAQDRSTPGDFGLESEGYLSGLAPEGLVIVNPAEIQRSRWWYSHYVSDIAAYLGVDLAPRSKVFVSHEMPDGPRKSVGLLRQVGARALHENYAQLPRLLGEQ